MLKMQVVSPVKRQKKAQACICSQQTKSQQKIWRNAKKNKKGRLPVVVHQAKTRRGGHNNNKWSG
jgi:hypothetical protein